MNSSLPEHILHDLQDAFPECMLYIDAGVGHLRFRVLSRNAEVLEDQILPSSRELKGLLTELSVRERFGNGPTAPVFITGKLGPMVHEALGGGRLLRQSAVQWLSLKSRVRLQAIPTALIEISASGYGLVGVDAAGELKDDLLLQNPRCGAGTGVNVDRVLQKLGIARSEVDTILGEYLGEAGQSARTRIHTRADRCGVFGASATISDKNQGIPLSVALATTLKSETLKVCRKLPEGFQRVVMLGRFFKWQFVRDCAEDHLRSLGVQDIVYDPEGSSVLDALHELVCGMDLGKVPPSAFAFRTLEKHKEYPSFSSLYAQYTHPKDRRYCRMENQTEGFSVAPPPNISDIPVHIGLDVGSTMAKVVMGDDTGALLFVEAYSNAGDTISTVKRVFSRLQEEGISTLSVRSIGITGSARYQVREALTRLYPKLSSRIAVLVENYAHARGSIDQARAHLKALKAAGVQNLNENFCILVDIGGEDTKISTLALQEAELFNNAMNIKCSAGTGSLMDTLSALFGIPGAGDASRAAMRAPKAYEINATCAVFLMENAQKLQAQGVPREEILASANWAIVENMARTLWQQLELPAHTVVLLHGQTMLSDPLPLAVTHRLQDFLAGPTYALVPPYPGHRACIGLIRTMQRSSPEGAEPMDFSAFLGSRFDKRIIQCQGAACDDPEAVCNRTSLKCQGADGKQFTFTLGGCSAINELFAKAKDRKDGKLETPSVPVRDTYKEIWDFIDSHHPRTEDPRRLIIPRSFVVSEWAYFFSQIFIPLGIPVHVDNVCDKDLTRAQPMFDVDSCAPHMGAVGQFQRLAASPHGYILAPQIERLPTQGTSMGRTCTLNQGGFAVARSLAQTACPDAKIHLFAVDFSELNAGALADQLFDRLMPVFEAYQVSLTRARLMAVIEQALEARRVLRARTAEKAADFMEEALTNGHRVAIVVGREYMLNPGIYDSHVRRLLRDKHMAAIPSYVLDIALNADFGHVYWRNPHVMTTVLEAVASKTLHTRVLQARLAAIFERLESGEDLLPVVQISTFCCGPDSVTLPISAELMKKRPFLLIQSDAIIKELAHLENRVNTYVRQLESGLHEKLSVGGEREFEIRALDQLENDRPLDPQKDVIYIPTLGDNRVLTSVLRGAGFTCIDNYHDAFDLQGNIRRGRESVGDSICAPMAGVYADLLRAQEDFIARQSAGDPLLAGKTRLLFFDNTGTGPCRQGQYVEVHKLSAWKDGLALSKTPQSGLGEANDACTSGAGATLRFLIAREADGYNVGGLPEWTLFRLYQGAILQGLMHEMHFQASLVCEDATAYEAFYADFLKMKEKVYAILENFKGPRTWGRQCSRLPGALGLVSKYYSYRLDGRDVTVPLREFAARWFSSPRPTASGVKPLHIHVTGEAYMRVAQAESIFRNLLGLLGFGRFRMENAPLWSYMDYLVEEVTGDEEDRIARARAEFERTGAAAARDRLKASEAKLKRLSQLRWILRHWIARPLYAAVGIPMPLSAQEAMQAAKEVLPTLRPIGELAPYAGEVLAGFRQGSELFLNVAPNACMVSTMGQVLSPHLRKVAGGEGRIQHLFSADGEIDDELLAAALLKTLGPEAFVGQGAHAEVVC